MNQILRQDFNKTLKDKEFSWRFQIKQDGLYGIEITASCKSWYQNFPKKIFLKVLGGILRATFPKIFLRFFFKKDDDLTVKINDISFPKKSGKKGLFDSEVAWNGNKLRGAKKTNFFLINLSPGSHQLNFLIDQSPKLKTVRIFQIRDKDISYLPQDNYPSSKSNRIPWLTIVLVNLGLEKLKITASVKQGRKFLKFSRDAADLKLIINGQIQKNPESILHRYWYWAGNLLKGKSKTFEKEFNLEPDIHYLELWVDRNPKVEEMKIGVGEGRDIQTYIYKGVKNNEDYNRFDQEILEAVNHWNKFFFSQKYPPQEPLHPNLVKAMIYIESRMGYEEGGFPDVMQVWDKKNNTPQTIRGKEGYLANEYISDTEYDHMNYSYPKEWLPPKIETSKESIFWGVRWFYHKAQYLKTSNTNPSKLIYPYIREWFSWEEALVRYNPHYWYKERVIRVYKQGIDQDDNILWGGNPNGFSLIKILGLISLLATVFLIGGFYGVNLYESEIEVCNQDVKNTDTPYYYGYSNKTDEPVKKKFLEDLGEYKKDKNYYGSVFKEAVKLCEKVRCCLECVVYGYYDELVNHMKSNEQFLEAVEVFNFMKNVRTGDVDNDGENEIIFVIRDALNRHHIRIEIIDKIDGKFQRKEHKIEYGYDGYVKLLDVTGDIQPEILLFISYGRGGYPLSVYQYLANKKLQKILESDFALFPKYTFSDLDHDGQIEIKMEGEIKDAPRDYRALVQKIYEYSKEKNDFIKIKEIEEES